MPVTPTLLVKTVTTAGTQIQVTADTTIKPYAVYFEALATNTGYIYIGDADVSSTNYMARLTIPSASNAPSWAIRASDLSDHGIQLSNFWVDSSVNGEKVMVTYMYKTGG